jgi:hypothetical protein
MLDIKAMKQAVNDVAKNVKDETSYQAALAGLKGKSLMRLAR